MTKPDHDTDAPPRERRSTDALIPLIAQIQEDVTQLRREMVDHALNGARVLADEITKAMNRAYPAGDPDGHRAYHEAQIREIESRAAFWKMMLFELTKFGLIGFTGWAVYALWRSFLNGPGT